MEITKSEQEDGSPWSLPLPIDDDSSSKAPELLGRAYFSELGIVRRKPSRADAPISLSKSCSDKMAMAQCTSLLGSITSVLISPTNLYLASITLPTSQYSAEACQRAFSRNGRMKFLSGKDWGNGYRYSPFQILTTNREFQLSRRTSTSPALGKKHVASNLASWWMPTHDETLIAGVIQGRKQYDIRGASKLCKARMWKLALQVASFLSVPVLGRCLRTERYDEVKQSALLKGRQEVKREVRELALKPWIRNDGGDDFQLPDIQP